MARISFFGQSYQAYSPNWDNERSINIAREILQAEGAKTAKGAFVTPGKTVFATLPVELSAKEVFQVNGRMFAAAQNFYEINAAGGVTQRGVLNGIPVTKPQIRSNQIQLLILSNGNLYVFTLATNAFVPVNMAQFNGPVQQIEFVDGYFLATIQNTNTFQQSNLEDGTTWTGQNISTISLFPDNITSMIVNDRQPIFFSGKKSQIYTNAGSGFPVFIPVPNALIENGAGATFATVQADNTVFWLNQDDRGAFIAFRLNGTKGDRVSTHATEMAWQRYPVASDAIGYSYQEFGHIFWSIWFPSANTTWVYDISTNEWHERGRWIDNLGKYEADHAVSHTYCFGKHLVGDWALGIIYQQSMDIRTDNGQSIRWERQTSSTSKENEWIYYGEARFDTETGLVPTASDIAAWTAHYGTPSLLDGNGIPRQPQFIFRWSNNNGRTWSNDYIMNCGFPGQGAGDKLVRKRQLGRGRNRLWNISGTDPIAWAFADAYIQANPGYEVAERITDQMRKVS